MANNRALRDEYHRKLRLELQCVDMQVRLVHIARTRIAAVGSMWPPSLSSSPHPGTDGNAVSSPEMRLSSENAAHAPDLQRAP
jgi:hypothetical protein